MIEIYIYGCTTCGINAMLISKVKRNHSEVEVFNSAQIDNRHKHRAYLTQAGMDTKTLPAIIVTDNGKRIMRLSEWKLI